ncbi:TetR/AcrR family transcriptional regulator C-terminal domain-containing protein [Bacillus sp. YZJH907-2]|uniref:TetR/AcrR family transcriptional regulator C-terminal domain-containing protein n=2 Tax=Halalkalibacter suaedae TaxID=2822140 RepID=A0A940WWB3_9BACI|nr:TetR-like C-terminal domain-containing protein [Bacillus suaedae]MBP3952883.1 TetR/AcrR family transcriptional regulator C-terminal domain-containing protein [Bacillus suaedae]
MKRALLSLMKKKDFKSISITEIVHEADVNRGTFYKNYVYKEDILDEIICDVTNDLIMSFREPYKDLEKIDVRYLTSKAIKIFEHVETHASFYTLIASSTNFAGFENKLCQEIKQLLFNDFAYSLSNQTIDINILASYHSYALVGMIMEWVHTDYQYSSEYMAEQLLEIIRNSQRISIKEISVEVVEKKSN